MNTKMKHAVRNVTEAKFRALCKRWGTPDEIPIWELSEAQAGVLCDADRDFVDAWDVDEAVELFREWELF